MFSNSVEGLQLGPMNDRDEQINDPSINEARLTGLVPNMKYRVHIFARTQQGRGEDFFIEGRTLTKSGLFL